ncbi:helix-turn-helix transcriptional regulator [bacterium]|nr:helix-turn-helix transcriptional regulator [bacterium]
MPRTAYSCGLEAALDVIGGKWKVLILWRLHEGPLRFGELRRLVPGVTEKMLVQQLREMEADGLVSRTVYPEVPPRVEYALTDIALELNEALPPLCAWGTKHIARIAARHLGDDAALPACAEAGA